MAGILSDAKLLLGSNIVCYGEVSTLTELNNELKVSVFSFKVEYTLGIASSEF